MPLDTSLFSHLHGGVDYHVILTKDFKDEEKIFSLATPNAAASAYKRVWDLIPKPPTIVKDIEKVLRSILTVAEHKGIAVDGIGDREGKRRLPVDNPQRGGSRTRKLAPDNYEGEKYDLHPDVVPAMGGIIVKAELKYEDGSE